MVQIEHVSNLAEAILDEQPTDAAVEYNDRCAPKLRRQVRLHEAEVERLVDRRAEGSTIMELANEFGIHRTTVMSHLKRNRAPQ